VLATSTRTTHFAAAVTAGGSSASPGARPSICRRCPGFVYATAITDSLLRTGTYKRAGDRRRDVLAHLD
jgi:hypothetical protein